MNKFDKAQGILKELDGDGWLIICNEDSDVNSRFLLGVGSHAFHIIYVAADGRHKIFPTVMESNMIKNSLESKDIDAEILPYDSFQIIFNLDFCYCF